MGNFTQGPWAVDPLNMGLVGDISTADGKKVVAQSQQIVSTIVDPSQSERRANSFLIAAAPDMYNALWEVVELSDRTLPPSGRTAECQRVYDLCRAALKKAEGDA